MRLRLEGTPKAAPAELVGPLSAELLAHAKKEPQHPRPVGSQRRRASFGGRSKVASFWRCPKSF